MIYMKHCFNELCYRFLFAYFQAGLDDHSEAQGTPREPGSPETASPTRAISSAEGTGKAAGDGASSKHEHVCCCFNPV